ncbi:VOC family protein [Rathayibacter festucae]|uniref:VOC family protein n=1 Tax=Rathayibacter festucae TaxID=110937 RepID=UPI001FB26019|nr:VOC family protein [Rathayibacter festucae]MCJ1698554.1 VOC family protein [Rathayibacter festucae]
MAITGPDFLSLQVRDLERSAEFYETRLGLSRRPGPPHAVVFDTAPIPFAIRTVLIPFASRDNLPGTQLPAEPGRGVALWLHATEVAALHDDLAAAGVPITSAPAEGPFGLTFTFADPDGYLITLHDRA